MKMNSRSSSNKSPYKYILPCASLVLSLLAHNALASNPSQFWDNNGLSPAGDGTWDTSTPNWAPTNALTAMPSVFTNGNFAEFAAGTGTNAVLNINLADNTVVCAGIATGFAGFTGETVSTANFSGVGSIGIASGLQGFLCPVGGSMVFNVPLTGAGGIDPQGGVVTLNGTNTFTGNSAIGTGTQLIIGGAGSLGSGSFAGSIANTGAFIYDSSAAQIFSGPITGTAGTLTNIGSGILTLLATNTYTGATMIGNGSTLIIGTTGLFGSAGAYSGTFVNNGTINFENDTVANAQTLSGVISGSGTVNVLNCAAANGGTAPAGQLSLTAPSGNTYTGITTITNGYLLITNDNGLGTPPATLVSNQLTMNMPLDGHIYGLRLQSHSTSLAATRGIYVGATGSGVVGGAVNAQAGNTLTILGPISGPGSFSAGCNGSFGNGTIVLNNAGNTYAGSTFIGCGTLQLGVSGALPAGSPLTLYAPAGAAATLNMNSFNQTIGPLQTAAALGGTGTLPASLKLTGALTVLETNISTTFGAVISGAGGSLTINTAGGGTPGVLSLTATNTYTGPTIINGATLALNGMGAISNTASITIGAGGTFDVSALTAATFNLSSSTALSASGTGIALGSSAATINGQSGGVVNLGAQAISLTFTPTAFRGDSNHPALYISQGTLNLGGNVISVTNSGASPLGAGTYVLIQAPAITGTVTTNVVVSGNGLAAGATASVSISGSNVILTVTGSASLTRPTITGFSLTGTSLHLTATNGTPGGNYVLLESTNVLLPQHLWTPVLTNSFDGSGNISLTTNVATTNSIEFYSIQNP
jgi:fibronectin-binding autotransporter adhesin